MKKFAIALLCVILATTLVIAAACNAPTVKGIEITKQPSKTAYNVGETFNVAGMEVSKVMSDGTKEPVYDYEVDKTAPLTEADTVVTVTWGEFTATVNITVGGSSGNKTITGIELAADSVKYVRTQDVSQNISAREVYSDGTTGYYAAISPSDISDYKIEDGKLVVTVTQTLLNNDYTATVSFDMDETFVSVKELLEQEQGANAVVEGVIVAIASAGPITVEYVLYDETNKQFVGVTGIGDSQGRLYNQSYEATFEVGDKVRIPVTLTKAGDNANNGNSNKVYAAYAGGTWYETGVISKGNVVSVDKADATVISTNEQLHAYLTKAERETHYYEMVKLHGKLNFIYYGSSAAFYRMFFDGINTYAAQKVEGNCSPVLDNGAQSYTTGKSVGELLGMSKDWAPSDWSNPGTVTKDVYALFIGGNNYYYNFVILSESDVEEVTPVLKNTIFNQPNNLYYKLNDEFSLEGAEIVYEYDYGPSKTVAVTTEMLDASTLPKMDQKGEYVVKGSYEGYSFQFTVTVTDKIVRSVELATQPSKTAFHVRGSWADVVAMLTEMELKVTYEDDSEGNVAITEGMLTCPTEWTAGQHQVTIAYLGKSTTVNITIEDQSLSVAELKTKPAGDEIYDVKGIVVGSAFISGTESSPANPELLLRDKKTNALIGVKGLAITAADKLAGLKVGDEIMIRVKVVVTSVAANVSECGKLAASKADDAEITVLSHDNDAKIDTTGAVEIYNQETLTAFLKDADTRKGNAYKLIKLCAGAKLANYGASSDGLYITFTGTSVATAKIDNLSPYLHQMNETMTMGEAEAVRKALIGPDSVRTPFGAENVNVMSKDAYLLYIGGQGTYYHQFILLSADYVTDSASEHFREYKFTAPSKTVYDVNDNLEIADGKIEEVYWYTAQNKTIQLTDQSVTKEAPDMTTPGNYTVKFTYKGQQFQYDIIVKNGDPTKIEIADGAPELRIADKAGYATLDVSQVKLKVYYGDEISLEIPLEKSMLPAEDTQHGWETVNYTVTYQNLTVQLPVKYEPLSVKEFNAAANGTYYMRATVVGPSSYFAAIALLVKDTQTMDFVQIINTGNVGKYNAPAFDEKAFGFKRGAEIIVKVNKTKYAVDATKGNSGMPYATGTDAETFAANTEIVKTEGTVTYDLAQVKKEISTQEQLVQFLNDGSRFHQMVKFTGLKAVTNGANINFFFGDKVTSAAEQKVNSIPPAFMGVNSNYYLGEDGIKTFFDTTSADYAAPMTAKGDVYALFIGGNGFYQIFIVLDSSWLVENA